MINRSNRSTKDIAKSGCGNQNANTTNISELYIQMVELMRTTNADAVPDANSNKMTAQEYFHAPSSYDPKVRIRVFGFG